TTARTATITGSSITGLAPATINYTAGQVSGLLIIAGGGGNTFTVQGTGSGTVTTLFSGWGNDAVNVQGTPGGLDIVSSDGTDTVTVGSLAPSLGGTLGNVFGPVVVGANLSGTISLNVDDSADTAFRTATIASGTITGLAPAAIYYNSQQVVTVTVLGGS